MLENNCEVVAVPRGCKICEEVTVVDVYTAFNTNLSGNNQFKYTSIEILKNEDVVKLTSHFVVCPHCGQQTPAYMHFIRGDYEPKKLFSKNDASLWLEEAMSFFETRNKVIPLYKPITESDTFKCMHCGAESKCNESKVLVTFTKTDEEVIVSYPLKSIGDIVHVNWNEEYLNINEFPLCEYITFNFNKGTTVLELKTLSGNTLMSRDITMGVDACDFESPLIDVLSKNVLIKRKLKRLFAEFWGKPLPFREYQLDIYTFSLATAYIGYEDTSFYIYIPYRRGTKEIDESFEDISLKLHFSDDIVSLYQQSSLPQMKSIRKKMFKNPALFFYVDELEKLWECTGKEPNFFGAFLDNKHVFSNLRFLHDFPVISRLYEDICKEDLYVPFKNMLADYPESVNEYALIYASLSDKKREDEKERLKLTSCRCMRFGNGVSQYFLNIPERDLAEGIPVQRVDGLVFSPLKSMNDYLIAGQELDNCLGAEEFDTPVVGVLKFGKYVAAIQVDTESNNIIQAYLKDNRSIDSNEFIYAAFKKWCKKNSYEFDLEDCSVF